MGLATWCLEICMALAALILVLGLCLSKRLRWQRDLFPILFYTQAVVYLHIGPMLSLSVMDRGRDRGYLILQAACLFLFEAPFILCYSHLAKGIEVRGQGDSIVVFRLFAGSIFAISMLVWCFLFIAVGFREGLVYVRVGNEGLMHALTSTGTIDFVVYRGFLQWGRALLVLLWLMTTARSGRAHWVSYGAAGVVTAIFIGFEGINSKLAPLMAILSGVGVFLLVRQQEFTRRLKGLGARRIVVAIVLIAYGFRVANNARAMYTVGAAISIEMLNPFRQADSAVVSDQSLWLRMNGIDLMDMIYDSSRFQGFAWGEAWRIPFKAAIVQLYDREEANNLKRSYLVTSKVYFLKNYTNLSQVDYYSCLLTDLFGNFGLWGFPFGAVFLALLFYWGGRLIRRANGCLPLLVGIVIEISVMQFENDFANALFGWVKFAPLIILFLFYRPFSIRQSKQGRRFEIRFPIGVASANVRTIAPQV